MANPQKENGYTAIANEIFKQICKLKLNGTQHRLIMAIWRATYGFKKKEHELSLSYLATYINSHCNVIGRELKNLQKMQIIKIVDNPIKNHSRLLSFNKNYDEWGINQSVDPTEQLTQPISCNSTNQSVDSRPNQSVDQKRNIINKNKKEIYSAFFDSVWELYPNKKGKSKVNKNSIKDLQKLGFEKVKQCIDAYVLQKPDWQQWQNGSTFFNGGYLDYLGADAENQKEGVGNLPSDTEWQ